MATAELQQMSQEELDKIIIKAKDQRFIRYYKVIYKCIWKGWTCCKVDLTDKDNPVYDYDSVKPYATWIDQWDLIDCSDLVFSFLNKEFNLYFGCPEKNFDQFKTGM